LKSPDRSAEEQIACDGTGIATFLAFAAFAIAVAVRSLQILGVERNVFMGLLGSIISWAVFGLIVGLIARALYPGRQKLGFLGTMMLGILGSFMGGFISWMVGFHPEEGAFRGAGWIMSIVGAMIVVWIALYSQRERAT